MISIRILCALAAGTLAFPICFRADAAQPLPSDALELVRNEIDPADSPGDRAAVLELLARARNTYALRSSGQGYQLKTSFEVNSDGATRYDGAWTMEDIFDPRLGLRWTASAASAYTITELSLHGEVYADGTPGPIPLRLHEARAALFDPLPSPAYLERAAIRRSEAAFRGASVTCVLVSAQRTAPTAAGRAWEESEDCIEPQSGLLLVHSQVPGRYYAYDYSNAPEFAGRRFPSKVTITEGGKIVSTITVDNLRELPSADPGLFLPTPEMKERGRAIAMAGAQKISHLVGLGPVLHSVCVFGLVTPSGELVEAHSLQPLDPYSAAAVADVKQLNFSRPSPRGKFGAIPRQYFVFVIEKFGSAQ